MRFVTGLINTKKAQLMALEIKLFMIGFGIGFTIAIVAIVVLSILGIIPDLIMNLLCRCG